MLWSYCRSNIKKHVPVFILSIPSLWDFAREMRSHRGSVYCRAVAPDCIRLRRCLKCCVHPSPLPPMRLVCFCGGNFQVGPACLCFSFTAGIHFRKRKKKKKKSCYACKFSESEREVEKKKREVKAGINASV